ncbi:DUF1266 domain-containing protein [Nocardia sp. NPDC055321]
MTDDATVVVPETMGFAELGGTFVKKWSGAAVTDDQIRALAVGAFYTSKWSVYNDDLALEPRHHTDTSTRRESAIEMLHESWGVDNADDARDTLSRLLHGMHAPLFDLIHPLAAAAAADRTEIDRGGLVEEHRDFLRVMARYRGYRDVDGLVRDYDAWRQAITLGITEQLPQPLHTNTVAWDLARLVLIVRGAYTAGYLDQQSGWSYLHAGLDRAQHNYANWHQFADGFLTGSVFWAATKDLAAAQRQIPDRRETLRDIHIAPGSAWRRVALHPGGSLFGETPQG